MSNVPLMESNNPKRFHSLASRLLTYERALSVDELAELLGMTRITVLRQARKGLIPSFKVGREVKFDSSNVARWLIRQGVQRESERKR